MSKNSLMSYSGLNRDIFGLMDDMFDSFWKEPSMQFSRNWRPTDINQTEKNYTVEVELPRFKKEEIKVEVDKGMLTINAKNNRCAYTRSFSLSDADFEKSDVKLEDGVLTIVIPKNDVKQVKTLEIKTAKQLSS